jgi:hypothetical protein
MWSNFFGLQDQSLTLEHFPNNRLIDFQAMMDREADILAGEEALKDLPLKSQQSMKGDSKTVGKAPSIMNASDAGDQDTVNSDKRPDSKTDARSMKRTESEILNDAELWNVTDSEDEDARK